jgi:hypothetical protein
MKKHIPHHLKAKIAFKFNLKKSDRPKKLVIGSGDRHLEPKSITIRKI